MSTPLQKARIFIEALPYLKSFDRKFVVIKVGGSTMTDEKTLPSVLTDVAFLEQVGIWPLLVHGGGPRISAEMERLGLKPHFIQGRRVTDGPTMEVAHKVLIDEISANVVTLIETAGGKAVALNGRGTQFLQCKKLVERGLDLGFVGEITRVDTELVRRMAMGGIIPVVAPIARGADGQLYNINADSVAWRLAAELEAAKLVFLSNVPGLMKDKDDPASLISSVGVPDCFKMLKDGTIVGGMIPKVEACMNALDGGVQKTHIISGLQKHALLLELFTPEGIGTEIHW
jgi:acetylglutamate kinase